MYHFIVNRREIILPRKQKLDVKLGDDSVNVLFFEEHEKLIARGKTR